MTTSLPDNHSQPPAYITSSATLCDIKIICTQRKKKSRSNIYLTFVESCPSSDESTHIEIFEKNGSSSIFLHDCLSFEFFDTIKNDYQSFIYIYFQSNTVSIYFPDDSINKKLLIIKHLEYIYQKKIEKSNDQQPLEDLPCQSTTEHILHTFDIKLIPYDRIITRDHPLVGPVRLYFTTTDLYIASRDCNQIDLKTTITNQCPLRMNEIFCIPYYTIRHYGNRSRIFLIELGKSNYGNGEIHMKCSSSSLASTIHLLVSPVIEERPIFLSSAFRDGLLTRRRIEKFKAIDPPIPLKTHSVEQLTIRKSRSVFGLFRKLVKNTNSLQRSSTIDDQQEILPIQPFGNKYFAFNVNAEKLLHDRNTIISSQNNHKTSGRVLNQQERTIGTYIDMDSTVQKSNQIEEIKEEGTIKELTTTVDIGVNTVISLSPHVHSAILVGTSFHLIAEERSVYPIGQRSYTSPASVMQPFKAQLNGQTNSKATSTYCQSLLLSYGIVTFSNNSHTDYVSDGSTIDHRLQSDLSLMSISHQEQPSNIFSYDNILSSSSSSQIFRTLSLSANNLGDNSSYRFRTSNGNMIFFGEHFSDQTTSYLLGPPPTTFIENTIQTTPIKSLSRSRLTSIEQDKLSFNDSYALTEPLTVENDSPIKQEQSVNYTDVLCPVNTGDNDSSDENMNEQFFYTDIDFHRTQRRNRIAQLAAISKMEDQLPPFVL